jgi:hypothetical protein
MGCAQLVLSGDNLGQCQQCQYQRSLEQFLPRGALAIQLHEVELVLIGPSRYQHLSRMHSQLPLTLR